MPMRLDEGWNQIQFNLADFTRRAYGTNYVLCLAPSTGLERTKTKMQDDHVIVGHVVRKWVSEALDIFIAARFKGKNFTGKLFPGLTVAKLEKQVRRAVDLVGDVTELPEITPHTMRHSGPSNDIFRGWRKLEEVRLRGRWAAMTSVQRYTKHAKLLRSTKKIPAKVATKAKQSEFNLREAMLRDGKPKEHREATPQHSATATTTAPSSSSKRG